MGLPAPWESVSVGRGAYKLPGGERGKKKALEAQPAFTHSCKVSGIIYSAE